MKKTRALKQLPERNDSSRINDPAYWMWSYGVGLLYTGVCAVILLEFGVRFGTLKFHGYTTATFLIYLLIAGAVRKIKLDP